MASANGVVKSQQISIQIDERQGHNTSEKMVNYEMGKTETLTKISFCCFELEQFTWSPLFRFGELEYEIDSIYWVGEQFIPQILAFNPRTHAYAWTLVSFPFCSNFMTIVTILHLLNSNYLTDTWVHLYWRNGVIREFYIRLPKQ